MLMSLQKKIQTLPDLKFPYKITIQDSAVTDSALCFFIHTFCQYQTWPHAGTLQKTKIFFLSYVVSDGSSDMETLDSDLATITAVHNLLI
jgi:hypothetical protein